MGGDWFWEQFCLTKRRESWHKFPIDLGRISARLTSSDYDALTEAYLSPFFKRAILTWVRQGLKADFRCVRKPPSTNLNAPHRAVR